MTSTAHPGVGPTSAEHQRKNPMEQLIDALVNGIIVPVTSVIPVLVSSGALFVLFAILWIAFGVGLVMSQGNVDAAWHWVRDLPLIVQGVVWVLFLPVVAGLWVWETTWPVIVRLILVAGLAWWNLFMFLPRAVTSAKP
jgi:hypothetical protein